MSDNDKNRIKIKLPAVSYDIVKLAATLTGTSVKSFAAQAVINAALHVTAEIENRSLGSNIEADIHLTEEEAQALLALVESLDTHDGKSRKPPPRTSRKKNPRNANVIAKSNASVTATASARTTPNASAKSPKRLKSLPLRPLPLPSPRPGTAATTADLST